MPTTATPRRQERRRRPGARLALLAFGALLLTGCDGREFYEDTFGMGWPKPVTEEGDKMYDLWLGSVAAAAAVGAFVLALILWACVAYRKKSDALPRQVRYNLPIEVLYTVVPMVIISVLFYYTVEGQNFVNEESDNPDIEIGVVGFQWNWQFNHLDGDGDDTNNVVVTGEPLKPARLVLPTGQKIRFIEQSNDVIHSFWVPSFLFKRDAVPGLVNTFEITIKPGFEGTYIGRCAELCGEKHDRMNFEVEAVTLAEYEQYLADAKADMSEDAPAPGVADDGTTEIRDNAGEGHSEGGEEGEESEDAENEAAAAPGGTP